MRRLVVCALPLVAILGCDPGSADDAAKLGALTQRVTDLEQRLRKAEAATDPIDALRNDVASLDRRLSAAESGLREVAARSVPPPGAGTSATAPPRGTPLGDHPQRGGPLTREQRGQRRAALRALNDELRGRLQELRAARGGDGAAADPQATQEILQWYRSERQAILRGTPPAQ